jgi:rhodanese-related sulfurtransferase
MGISSVSPAKLAEIINSGQKIELIDVRTPVEFREVHLDIACNIPLDRLDPSGFLLGHGGPRSEPLYVICKSGGRSRQACEKLFAAGLTNVVNVEGGTTGCMDAGLPVTHGKQAVSLDRQVRIAAGSLVILGVIGSYTVNSNLVWLSAFVGAGLVFSGVTNTCGMGMFLARMPWNRCSSDKNSCSER